MYILLDNIGAKAYNVSMIKKKEEINKTEGEKMTKENAVGKKVLKDGYEGIIVRVYDWPMVEVRLSRGLVCVDISDLQLKE